MPAEQHCPICGVRVAVSERYPRYICAACAQRAQSADGRALRFWNVDMSGGFSGTYADTGEPYAGHACFVDGVPCHADEARFGGIVIQVEAAYDRST
ncbi:MAG: hypothetical protein H7Y32_20865 [Chloroflexales bacterium]|nr:hypothetical protein [Chloroflexales bacterium]